MFLADGRGSGDKSEAVQRRCVGSVVPVSLHGGQRLSFEFEGFLAHAAEQAHKEDTGLCGFVECSRRRVENELNTI